MSSWWWDLQAWWRSGDIFMPVMLATALALYTLVGERLWGLCLEPLPACRNLTPAQAALVQRHELTRGFAVIRALTLSLPLLGLLGTVSGMVRTFASLGGNIDAALTQGAGAGIAVALAATQYGILLAVPAMVAMWLLRRRAELLLERVPTASIAQEPA